MPTRFTPELLSKESSLPNKRIKMNESHETKAKQTSKIPKKTPSHKTKSKPTKDNKHAIDLTKFKSILLKPKKNITAYAFFIKERKSQFSASNKTGKIAPVLMKEFGQEWSELSEEKKESYKQKARDDKLRYEKEFKEFVQKCGSIQKIREWEKNRPKKPLTSYMIFVRKIRSEVCKQHPDMHSFQVMKEVGKLWKKLDKDDRKVFEKQSQDDQQKFLTEQKIFEKKLAMGDLNNHEENQTQHNKIISEKSFLGLSIEPKIIESSVSFPKNKMTQVKFNKVTTSEGSEIKEDRSNKSRDSFTNDSSQKGYNPAKTLQMVTRQVLDVWNNEINQDISKPSLAASEQGEAIRLVMEDDINQDKLPPLTQICDTMNSNLAKESFESENWDLDRRIFIETSQITEPITKYNFDTNVFRENLYEFMNQPRFEYQSETDLNFEENFNEIAGYPFRAEF
ncbi:unnamed protein product [Moneuplotes crassus]|uniref:HMG box domain-containing protein n=1 Tax=Euplotes crassus TaxID=5936 RepID=A0AAD1U1L7_EUPCR|nr:unnamed protein product [Moneuplotes crassus]